MNAENNHGFENPTLSVAEEADWIRFVDDPEASIDEIPKPEFAWAIVEKMLQNGGAEKRDGLVAKLVPDPETTLPPGEIRLRNGYDEEEMKLTFIKQLNPRASQTLEWQLSRSHDEMYRAWRTSGPAGIGEPGDDELFDLSKKLMHSYTLQPVDEKARR